MIDATTGLIYVGNRQYYDPETGRFLTRDFNPNSTNPYVPWNPIGMLVGPLAVISANEVRKKLRRIAKGITATSTLGIFLAACNQIIIGAIVFAIVVIAGVLACTPSNSPQDPNNSQNQNTGGSGTVTPTPVTTPSPAVEVPSTQDPCANGQCTATPRPTPTITKTIFFGGSGGDLSLPGPDPYHQTKVWADSATQVVPFPGGGRQGKPSQANSVDINSYKDTNLIVIGYSAGADTALIFADKFRNYQQSNIGGTGKITDIAVLGWTMTGLMTDGRDFAQEWTGVLDNLLMWGTDVYILDDKAYGGDASGYKAPADATGTFFFDQRLEQEHWDGGYPDGVGTNNSITYKDEVYNWFDAH